MHQTPTDYIGNELKVGDTLKSGGAERTLVKISKNDLGEPVVVLRNGGLLFSEERRNTTFTFDSLKYHTKWVKKLTDKGSDAGS